MPKRNSWDLKEDEMLRKLVAEGQYAMDVAVGMRRSESAVRLRTKQLDLKIAAAPKGRSLKAKK